MMIFKKSPKKAQNGPKIGFIGVPNWGPNPDPKMGSKKGPKKGVQNGPKRGPKPTPPPNRPFFGFWRKRAKKRKSRFLTPPFFGQQSTLANFDP